MKISNEMINHAIFQKLLVSSIFFIILIYSLFSINILDASLIRRTIRKCSLKTFFYERFRCTNFTRWTIFSGIDKDIVILLIYGLILNIAKILYHWIKKYSIRSIQNTFKMCELASIQLFLYIRIVFTWRKNISIMRLHSLYDVQSLLLLLS